METDQLLSDPNTNGFAAADHITAMLAYWDKDLVCRYASAAYMQWFEKTSDEMMGRITIKELLGSLYECNCEYISGALEGKNQIFESKTTSLYGSTRHAIVNYFPDIADGEVRGFYAHIADVTPMKLMEKELNRSYETISRQNNHLLNFANTVSHNFNTYACNLEAILDFWADATSEDEKNDLINLLSGISKAFGTSVRHLHHLAKIQNQVKLKCEWINLYNYVETTIYALEKQVRQTDAIIINRVNNSINLWANPAYIESIILNFLTNAIKYRQPGYRPIIELISGTTQDEIILNIRDNGLGIDMDRYGNKLFGMYNTFHSNHDAEGIGLFITKFQVESMGGHIEVKSEVNKGSTFTVYFPNRKFQTGLG